jgi:hypothetical protein
MKHAFQAMPLSSSALASLKVLAVCGRMRA